MESLLYYLVLYLAIGIAVFILDCFCEGLTMKPNIKYSSYSLIFLWPFELSFSIGTVVGYIFRIIRKKDK